MSLQYICALALALANISFAYQCTYTRYERCTGCPAHWYTSCPRGYVHETYRSCGFWTGWYWGCQLKCVRKFEQHCRDCNRPCKPTRKPTNTPKPTTVKPTPAPTKEPTDLPSFLPTSSPSRAPTGVPTRAPTTIVPTAAPSSNPTFTPTAFPSSSPTLTPTSAPSPVVDHCINTCVEMINPSDKCEDEVGCSLVCMPVCIVYEEIHRLISVEEFLIQWVASGYDDAGLLTLTPTAAPSNTPSPTIDEQEKRKRWQICLLFFNTQENESNKHCYRECMKIGPCVEKPKKCDTVCRHATCTINEDKTCQNDWIEDCIANPDMWRDTVKWDTRVRISEEKPFPCNENERRLKENMKEYDGSVDIVEYLYSKEEMDCPYPFLDCESG